MTFEVTFSTLATRQLFQAANRQNFAKLVFVLITSACSTTSSNIPLGLFEDFLGHDIATHRHLTITHLVRATVGMLCDGCVPGVLAELNLVLENCVKA